MFHEDGTYTEPIWGNEEGVVEGYMCKTSFDYEIEGDAQGVQIFPTINSIVKHKACARLGECEIARVGIMKACREQSDTLKKGYMEQISFDFELGGAVNVRVYPSEEMVKEYNPVYAFKYGVVAVDVKLLDVVNQNQKENNAN